MSKNKNASKFWNWSKNEVTNERTLHLDGVIASESWWGDEVTPKLFRDELFAADGDITIFINSPGGDCIAASQIYTILTEYKGNVTVKIDGLAASAASVIAMAGTSVLMAPTSLMMVHNPMTFAIGDSKEMRKAQDMLDEVKQSIINAYQIRTKQPRAKISNWMDAETWMNANKAIEYGFADGLLEDSKRQASEIAAAPTNYMFSRRAVTNSLLDKMQIRTTVTPTPAERQHVAKAKTEPPTPQGVCAESLNKRLSLIPHQNLNQRR